MRAGSHSWVLSKLDVGSIIYIPTTLDTYRVDMSVASVPRSRRPVILKDREFTAKLFTAISAKDAADIRYLIALERIK